MEEFKDIQKIILLTEEEFDRKLEEQYQRIRAEFNLLPEILDNEEAQALLKVGRSTLAKLRSEGKIPYSKSGRTIIYKRSDLMKYIEEHTYNTF